MQSQDYERRKERVFDAYREAYRGRYGEYPLRPFPDDYETLGKVIGRIGSAEMSVKLVRHFVTMDGYKDYFKSNGHTLAIFNSSVDRIFSDLNLNTGKAGLEEWFVVGYTETGKPKISGHARSENPPFTPVSWNAWLSQTHDQRLQGMNWEPNPVMQWRENWRVWEKQWHPR